MRRGIYFLGSLIIVAALIAFAAPIHAAEAVPGDACATAGSYKVSGGPELSGVGHIMVCSGSTWQSIADFDATGQLTQMGNQGCASGQLLKFDGTKWACAPDVTGVNSVWGVDRIFTAEPYSSATYGDLATVGPTVSMTTGTEALVTVTAAVINSANNKVCKMGFAVSGATTIAASDTYAMQVTHAAANPIPYQVSGTFYVTGLTAGLNTFTAKYAVTTTNTCTFSQRHLAVTAANTPTTCADTTPNTLALGNLINQTVSTLVTSSIAQVTGLSCAIPVSISGLGTPSYRICNDATCTSATGWLTTASTVTPGQYIQTRLTTSAKGGDTRYADLSLSGASTIWSAKTTGDCTTTSTVGTVCSDGTLYAGMSPDSHRMYVPRCQTSRRWDPITSTCVGVDIYLSWDNGNNGTIKTGINSSSNGLTNTNALAALSNADSPYSAAMYCYNYDDGNGNTDWYLAANGELQTIAANATALNLTADQFWSSTEVNDPVYGFTQAVMEGTVFTNYWQDKLVTHPPLCVRRT